MHNQINLILLSLKPDLKILSVQLQIQLIDILVLSKNIISCLLYVWYSKS